MGDSPQKDGAQAWLLVAIFVEAGLCMALCPVFTGELRSDYEECDGCVRWKQL